MQETAAEGEHAGCDAFLQAEKIRQATHEINRTASRRCLIISWRAARFSPAPGL